MYLKRHKYLFEYDVVVSQKGKENIIGCVECNINSKLFLGQYLKQYLCFEFAIIEFTIISHLLNILMFRKELYSIFLNKLLKIFL